MVMRKRLTIILVAFCISFLSMIALSLFSMGRFATFTDYLTDVSHSNNVIRALYKTEVYFKDIDRWERGYMVQADTGYIRVIANTTDSLQQMLDSLDRLVADNPVHARNMLDLRDEIRQRIDFSKENMRYMDTAKNKQVSPYYFEGRKHSIQVNRLLRVMHALENDVLEARMNKQVFYQQQTSSTIKTLLLIFCLVTLILFALLVKLMRSGMLYQETLQAKIIDLKRSHAELQDIAYLISHDLQEPLRKIQVFSNMLMVKKANAGMDDDSRGTLERIHGSANRMQSLIADLDRLTNLTRTDEQKKSADLNSLMDKLMTEMGQALKDKEAVVRVEQLPVIKVYESQVSALFRALVDNALKFAKEDRKPEIYISYKLSGAPELVDETRSIPNQQFHCISISDNGIGFENIYISNIFKIFKRLHNGQSRYGGKGIGLAICQRIMANHEGYIVGDGIQDKGATFKLYFPA